MPDDEMPDNNPLTSFSRMIINVPSVCKIYKKKYLKTIYNAKNICYNDTVYYSCFCSAFLFFVLQSRFCLKGRDVRVGAEAYVVRF